MTQQHLLTILTHIMDSLGLPVTVARHLPDPAPNTFVVLTPLVDVFDFYADNQPQVDVCEVQVSLFTTENYLEIAKRITEEVLAADLTVRARRYVGFEVDTSMHHWAIDVAHYFY